MNFFIWRPKSFSDALRNELLPHGVRDASDYEAHISALRSYARLIRGNKSPVYFIEISSTTALLQDVLDAADLDPRKPDDMQHALRTLWKYDPGTWSSKGDEFRGLIEHHLKARSLSRNWLAGVVCEDDQACCSSDTVMRYLRGDSDASSSVVAGCMRALDISFPQ
tara:strand:- start:7198 stop:7695 length:498 start_codon:yes stop_codon:yes gene_type:complete